MTQTWMTPQEFNESTGRPRTDLRELWAAGKINRKPKPFTHTVQRGHISADGIGGCSHQWIYDVTDLLTEALS